MKEAGRTDDGEAEDRTLVYGNLHLLSESSGRLSKIDTQ